MAIVVEPMTEALLADVVRIHFDAFADYMNTKLGTRYVQAFLSWFATQQDTVALAATRDGITVGYVVGAPLGYQRRLNRALLLEACLGMMIRPWLLLQPRVIAVCWRKFLMMTGLQENESPELSLPVPTMNLVGIGVSTEARGSGVSHSLMTAFEAVSRSHGMKSLCLTVYRSSTPARRLYEKHGWVSHEGGSMDSLYYFKTFSEAELGSTNSSSRGSGAVHAERM